MRRETVFRFNFTSGFLSTKEASFWTSSVPIYENILTTWWNHTKSTVHELWARKLALQPVLFQMTDDKSPTKIILLMQGVHTMKQTTLLKQLRSEITTRWSQPARRIHTGFYHFMEIQKPKKEKLRDRKKIHNLSKGSIAWILEKILVGSETTIYHRPVPCYI